MTPILGEMSCSFLTEFYVMAIDEQYFQKFHITGLCLLNCQISYADTESWMVLCEMAEQHPCIRN